MKTKFVDGRYILFMDLLGFSELVINSDVENVYEKLNTCIKVHHEWERIKQSFSTLYFSDTIIFYQLDKGYSRKTFLDIYSVSGLLFSAIVSQHIPVRGAITFGEFVVRRDSDKRHDLFFGKALIEAYHAERRENWLGTVICPSAWQYYETQRAFVDSHETEGLWKRRRKDDFLMTNPFNNISGWHKHQHVDESNIQLGGPALINELRAFRFIIDETSRFASDGDFSSKHAAKYHATTAFLREVLGLQCFEWADRISRNII